jgi:hypothetical protein
MDFFKNPGSFLQFWHFLRFLKIVFNQKSYGSGLWLTEPRLALCLWWTHGHGAAWPLRGSGGRCDSSEREGEITHRKRERERRVYWGSHQ